MLKKASERIPHFETLSALEKIVAIAEYARLDVISVLRKVGKAGVLPRKLYTAGIHYLSAKLDLTSKTTYREITEDLEALKKDGIVPEDADVLYVASYRDTCVRRAFPKTTHLDVRKPWPMPPNFNFIQANAEAIPLPSASMDLVFTMGGGASPSDDLQFDDKVIAEMNRVLRPDGTLIRRGNAVDSIAYTPCPRFHHFEFEIDRLKNLHQLHTHGFDIVGHMKTGFEIIKKTEIDPGKEAEVEKAVDRLLQRFFEDLGNGEIPLQYAGHVLDSFGLSPREFLPLDWEECKKKLEPVEVAIPPKAFKVIEQYLELIRRANALRNRAEKLVR